jgi:hypothetical protein
MAYRVVIEPDPDPDFSWLEQSSYDPASPDYDPVYAPKSMGGAVIDPEEYRDAANHAAQSIQLYYVDDNRDGDDGTYLAGVGNVDYYRPFHTVPEGVWDVDGPDDLPAEWDEFTRETVRDFDWSAPTEPNVPTVDVDGEPVELDDPDLDRVTVAFNAAIDRGQSEAQERGPLGWINSAQIVLDRQEDAVSVRISVGDPRGAFSMTVRRHADGTLHLSVPFEGEPAEHCALRRISHGHYVVR